MNIRIKSRIRYNGQEYSSPRDLPAEARAGYDKAMRAPALVAAHNIVINGHEFASEIDLPPGHKKIYDDVLALLQDNGEVTLPGVHHAEPLLTRGQSRLVFLLAGLLALAAFVILIR